MEEHISWRQPQGEKIEKALFDEYSEEEIRRHLEYLTTLTRRAGTADELKAAEYIKRQLDEYGVDANIHEFDVYVGEPRDSELKILSPLEKVIPSLPRIHIASTPAEGIEAELISLSGKSAEDVRQVDVRGKIVLIEGDRLSRRYVGPMAEKLGAVAQIQITRSKHGAINMGGVRVDWGSPVPETLEKVSTTSAVAIGNDDGRFLDELTQKGPVTVRLKASAWRGYKRIRVPVGHITGRQEPQKFVLLAGHYCGWFSGATDNAAADALILEMARVLSKHRQFLDRGVRFAWWSGHEQGPYSGSTAYADRFWDDIRDNAIAYFALDGIGRMGSSGFESRNTEEIRPFLEKVIKDVLGLDVVSERIPKSGDMSFTGNGVPAGMERTTFAKHQTDAEGFGPTWYSHTVEDTLDKVEIDTIRAPFIVHAATILRLCSHPILPFDFTAVLELFRKGLDELQTTDGAEVDLASLAPQMALLKKQLKTLHVRSGDLLKEIGEKESGLYVESACRRINDCLMGLGRILMPVLSSRSGKYHHDPMGTRFKPLPTLQPLLELNSMDRGSDAYKALQTALVRARNRLSDKLKAAGTLLASTLDTLQRKSP